MRIFACFTSVSLLFVICLFLCLAAAVALTLQAAFVHAFVGVWNRYSEALSSLRQTLNYTFLLCVRKRFRFCSKSSGTLKRLHLPVKSHAEVPNVTSLKRTLLAVSEKSKFSVQSRKCKHPQIVFVVFFIASYEQTHARARAATGVATAERAC